MGIKVVVEEEYLVKAYKYSNKVRNEELVLEKAKSCIFNLQLEWVKEEVEEVIKEVIANEVNEAIEEVIKKQYKKVIKQNLYNVVYNAIVEEALYGNIGSRELSLQTFRQKASKLSDKIVSILSESKDISPKYLYKLLVEEFISYFASIQL